MKSISYFLSDSLVESLGWTILHSLWQGAIIAVLLVIALITLRRNSSNIRYFVSIIALCMMFLSSVITFITLYQEALYQAGIQKKFTQNPSYLTDEKVIIEGANVQAEKWNEASSFSYLDFFSQYFDQHLPLIVALWLLGIITLMLRFLGGIAYVQRLKHYRTKPVSDFWQGTTHFLATQIHLRKPVRLLESAMVKVPMVIGFFKPVILLPIGTLAGLSQSQVESILAHELAHIRRNDYLVNILQSLVEIALFFNPFIWWISACVREERENCCDDIAVKITGDHLTFVKTLATLEELRLQNPTVAVAFVGKGGLLNRVSRLLNRNNPNATFSEGFLSAVLLVICLAIASIQANTPYHLALNMAGINPLATLTDNTLNPFKWVEDDQTEKTIEDKVKQNIAPLAQKLTKIGESAAQNFLPLKDDTVRFGNGFMLVTDGWGNVELFKDGKKIEEQDYSKYKEAFEFTPGKSWESSKNKSNARVYSFGYNQDDPTIWVAPKDKIYIPSEKMIPLPEIHIPNLNITIPKVTRFAFDWCNDGKNYRFHLNPDEEITELWINGKKIPQKDWDKYEDEIEDWKKKNKKKIKARQSVIVLEDKLRKLNGNVFYQDFNNPEFWEKTAEEYARQYERALERQEESLKRYNERMQQYEERLKERAKQWEERKENLKESRRKMKEIIQQFKNDGLLEQDAKRIEIRIKGTEKQTDIQVNGKKLSGEKLAKYKEIFEQYLNTDFDKKGSNYSWSYSDDGEDSDEDFDEDEDEE